MLWSIQCTFDEIYALGELMEVRRRDVSDFLERSVTILSRDQYWRAHGKFNDYRATLTEVDDPGEWFERCEDDNERIEEAALFFLFVYDVLGLRGDQVAKIRTGIAFCLNVRGYDSTFLSSDTIGRALKACRRSTAEARVYNSEVREKNLRNPTSVDLIKQIRIMYWIDRSWTTRCDLDARGTWLAIALGYDMGSRASNLVAPDGKKSVDHSVRTGEVSFLISDGIRPPFTLKGSDALKLEIVTGHLDFSVVVMTAEIIFVTSKTTGSLKSLQYVPKTLGRRSSAESSLLDDLIQWVLYSGTKDQDRLLCRYAGSDSRSRCITKKDVSSALKAGALVLGLDPKRYSSKSLRCGFTSAAKRANIPREELLLRGGWVPGSKVPDVFYTTYEGGGRGGMALMSDDSDEVTSSDESSLELKESAARGGKARPGKRVRESPGAGEV